MLHYYSVRNFQSFREKVEVDLTVGSKVRTTDWMAETPTGDRVSKLMAVIGPNGSGKTTLLKPLAFVGSFVSESFRTPPDADIHVVPHFASSDRPIEFECVLDFDGKLWRYELVCTAKRVLHEALFQKHERFRYVFVRDWDEVDSNYVVKQQEFGFSPAEAKKVRQNASLISTAAQYGVPLAQRMAAPFVISNVNFFGRRSLNEGHVISAAKHFSEHPEQKQLMSTLLTSWDLGLDHVELKEFTTTGPDNKVTKFWMPLGKHRGRGGEAVLSFLFESSGTQGAFVLLSQLLHALEIGGLAVIDEFENDLHPHMLEPILDLFSSPATNPHGAQLIFTCHAVEVLNIIHKSQVMLVEKNEDCESTACRLDAIPGVRSDDNLYAKYMAGAYGAVPNL